MKRRIVNVRDITLRIPWIETQVDVTWSLLKVLNEEQLLLQKDLMEYFVTQLSKDKDINDNLLNIIIMDHVDKLDVENVLEAMAQGEVDDIVYGQRQMLHLILKFLWERKHEYEDPLSGLESIYFDLDHPDDIHYICGMGGTPVNFGGFRDPNPRLNPEEACFLRWRIVIEDSDVLTKKNTNAEGVN